MKLFEGKTLQQRRAIGGSIAAVTAGAVILTSALVPMGATAAPADDSEALGQVIRTELLGGDILDVSQALSGNPSDIGPKVTPLNVSLLQGLTVDLGGGLQLPLISGPAGTGLLDLGELGALSSFAGSPTANTSTASAGAVTADGAIATDVNNPGAYGNAKVNLTDVLDQLGVAGITDQVVDNLGLELGAIASTATATGSTSDVAFDSQYAVADLELNVSSPLVGTVATSLGGVLGGVGDTLDAAVGTGGVLDSVVSAVDLDLGIPAVLQVQVGGGTISIDGLDAAITAATNTLITEPLADPNGIVSIDLANGLVSVDLAKIVNGPGATDLNGLDPNTLVLDDTTITAITSAVSAALGTLTTKVTTVVTDLINNLQVHIALGAHVTAAVVLNADVDITIDAKLGQLTGAIPGAPVVGVDGNLAGIDLGGVLSLVTTPVINLLTSTLSPVIGTLLTTVTSGLAPAIDAIINPVVTALSPLFDALNEVVEITINEQPTPGLLGAESFTVNAISLELLPGLGALNLDLASSTVRAAEVAAVDPTVDAQDPVQAGASLPVTGADWVPGSTVTLTLRNAANDTIGTPVTVTVTGTGGFPAGTVYGIPANTPVGTGYVLTAVDNQDPQNIATDTVSITAGGGGDVNTNAAASASASADATADGDPSAQAAAEAAAFSDATSIASAAATADAEAAAVAAATVTASSQASTTADADVNASAAVAAQAAAQADNSSTATADSSASTAANANSSVASQSAATADASTQASSEASTNANAAASASASANADASNDVVAQAAAQAAAYSDADASTSAAATAAANAAAQVAANATASTAATADATSASNANAAAAAQAAALADASSNVNAAGSTTGDPNTNASTASQAAAISDASTTASADAVGSATSSATATADPSATATATAEANTNASASAAASAQADNDNNAAAQAAAIAAATVDADSNTAASAAATANAEAAAAVAAQAEASAQASTDATSESNARAAAAAQSSAEADSSQAATAQANANASAAASNAANADASVNASATAAADATASATASATSTATASATASASANANPTGKLGITVKVPVLERGQQQTAVGTGFKPGEVVTGVMNSDPLALGTQVANAEGTVTFTWAIPAGTDLGTHTVTLTGAESGSVAGTFQVVAKGLATTGGTAPNGWIVLGALLLMFGLGTALVARSKRETIAAE
ncbi:hypothetical protein RS84_01334 [Microbacterium hydrocarbonoxydans]|uniref:Gram-positive cocci surface proteins LPxTG domain-containing protein n=1 Tax=Microbacterium hydrocarbonoxydans TaxID=273678 RepID=A0A0M2HVU4_9MICO|nr:hypothetical protein RS84_01334 [Microbacterium hydrocarbonoxydans]